MSGFGNTIGTGLTWSLQGDNFVAFVWLPEGLLLTPRSVDAKYGYGFPKRNPGVLKIESGIRVFNGGDKINPPFGTKIDIEDNEALNQVLINRFENNKYLDRRDFIVGLPTKDELKQICGRSIPIIPFPIDNRRLRDTIETKDETTPKPGLMPFVIYWPPFYYPISVSGNLTFWQESLNDQELRDKWFDNPGLNTWNTNGAYQPFFNKDLLLEDNYIAEYRQFLVDEETGLSNLFSESLIYEQETEQDWFCHWPEELLYDNDGFEMLFYMTNQYRAEVGRKPLIREIRGHAIAPRMILAECQRAQVLFHDNEELYRPGYSTYQRRFYNSGSNAIAGGENLQIGYATNLSINSGEQAAIAWRNSQIHYTNMISSYWDDPPYCTSHEIIGNISGKATDKQSGEMDDFAAGKFWSQVFTQRKYWLMAGNIQQKTRYGTISFFFNESPIGIPSVINEILWVNICYKGRLLFVWPLYDKLIAGYTGFVVGAALCLYNDIPHIRVIFHAAHDADLKYYVYRRPLHNNSNDGWIEECSWLRPDWTFPQNIASFNYEGDTAVLVQVNVKFDDTAIYYFPLASNQFQTFASSISHLQYKNGSFITLDEKTGPEIVYTIETAVDGSTTYMTRYKQSCEEQEIKLHPFYVPNSDTGETYLSYLTIRYNFIIDQIRTGYSDPVYHNEYSILETLVWPSGKELIIKKAEVISNEDKTAMILAEDAYIIVFLYLDPYYEDAVYLKLNLRGSGTSIYGQAIFYADLFDAETPVPIVTYSEQLINSIDLSHPNLNASWTGNPTASTVASGLISFGVAFERDENNIDHPLFLMTGGLWRCTGYTGSYRAYTQKPITGTHRGTLDTSFGTSSNCINQDDKMNFNYAANLKTAELFVDGFDCQATRYQDKFVAQLKFDLNKTPKPWQIPLDKENIVWANFDLENMIGIGELTNIVPFGAIV